VAQAGTFNCTNIAGGNWTTTTIWSNCGGAYPNDGANTYNATVATGTVSLSTGSPSIALNQLTVNSGATLNLGAVPTQILGSYNLQGSVTSTLDYENVTLSGAGTYLMGGTLADTVVNANIAFVGTNGVINGLGNPVLQGTGTITAVAGAQVSLDHATVSLEGLTLAGAGTFNAINLQTNWAEELWDLYGVANDSTINLATPTQANHSTFNVSGISTNTGVYQNNLTSAQGAYAFYQATLNGGTFSGTGLFYSTGAPC
jgi:hypothetical protein